VTEIQKAIGLDKLSEIAKNAGLPVDKANELLAQYLLVAVDKITPEGKLPPKLQSPRPSCARLTKEMLASVTQIPTKNIASLSLRTLGRKRCLIRTVSS